LNAVGADDVELCFAVGVEELGDVRHRYFQISFVVDELTLGVIDVTFARNWDDVEATDDGDLVLFLARERKKRKTDQIANVVDVVPFHVNSLEKLFQLMALASRCVGIARAVANSS
jgi:hypothetical protein